MDLFLYPYESTDTALYQIENYTLSYYKENLPEVYELRLDDINKSIEAIKDGFNHHIFPEMQASWDEYEDNIGHKTYNGCFRCHNDTHVSESGKVISKDCNQCHTIIAQGALEDKQVGDIGAALEFKHPVDIGEEWKESLCTDCHTGLNP